MYTKIKGIFHQIALMGFRDLLFPHIRFPIYRTFSLDFILLPDDRVPGNIRSSPIVSPAIPRVP